MLTEKTIQKRGVDALAYSLGNGATYCEGDIFAFDMRHGDEGPDSWTRHQLEITSELIEAAWQKAQ